MRTPSPPLRKGRRRPNDQIGEFAVRARVPSPLSARRESIGQPTGTPCAHPPLTPRGPAAELTQAVTAAKAELDAAEMRRVLLTTRAAGLRALQMLFDRNRTPASQTAAIGLLENAVVRLQQYIQGGGANGGGGGGTSEGHSRHEGHSGLDLRYQQPPRRFLPVRPLVDR
jgi:hypothetical protein